MIAGKVEPESVSAEWSIGADTETSSISYPSLGAVAREELITRAA